jgi:hypothetical protein
MKARTLTVAVACCVGLSACDAAPVSTAQTNNAEVPVALLFEHEGVRVYRFYDGGRNHYYAVPTDGRGAFTTRTWSEQSGKSRVTKAEDVPTLERQ